MAEGDITRPSGNRNILVDVEIDGVLKRAISTVDLL